MSEEVKLFTCRPYTTTDGKWLVHGPTLPELGMLWDNERQATIMRDCLNDALECGRDATITDLQAKLAEAELDPPITRLQFPNGNVPGNIRECAEGWKAAYDESAKCSSAYFKMAMENGESSCRQREAKEIAEAKLAAATIDVAAWDGMAAKIKALRAECVAYKLCLDKTVESLERGGFGSTVLCDQIRAVLKHAAADALSGGEGEGKVSNG